MIWSTLFPQVSSLYTWSHWHLTHMIELPADIQRGMRNQFPREARNSQANICWSIADYELFCGCISRLRLHRHQLSSRRARLCGYLCVVCESLPRAVVVIGRRSQLLEQDQSPCPESFSDMTAAVAAPICRTISEGLCSGSSSLGRTHLRLASRCPQKPQTYQWAAAQSFWRGRCSRMWLVLHPYLMQTSA